MTAEIDHWIWVVPDLVAGNDAIRARLGNSYFGGRHEGMGCANHIVPLQGRSYLEVLGPSDQPGPVRAALLKCRPRIASFGVRVSDLESVSRRAQELGLEVLGPSEYARIQPDGTPLNWRMIQLRGHGFGDYLPFFIDWLQSPHPSAAMPSQATVESFTVTYPSPALAPAYATLGIPLKVRRGAARMVLALRGPGGVEVLQSNGESDFLASTH